MFCDPQRREANSQKNVKVHKMSEFHNFGDFGTSPKGVTTSVTLHTCSRLKSISEGQKNPGHSNWVGEMKQTGNRVQKHCDIESYLCSAAMYDVPIPGIGNS